jgi:hypothetical protein
LRAYVTVGDGAELLVRFVVVAFFDSVVVLLVCRVWVWWLEGESVP